MDVEYLAAKRNTQYRHNLTDLCMLLFQQNKTIGGNTMARYTGPQWKKSRRLGFSTLETGKELSKRPYAPGQHGQKRKKPNSTKMLPTRVPTAHPRKSPG